MGGTMTVKEAAILWGFNMTYRQYYKNNIILINYGKSVKSRVKKDRPFGTKAMS